MFNIIDRLDHISILYVQNDALLFYKMGGELFVNNQRIDIFHNTIGGSFIDTKIIIANTEKYQFIYDFLDSRILSEGRFTLYCHK
jgi:hypothetical protein